jgi:hypothetical protein
MTYTINQNEPSEEFLRARHIAGCTIQAQFKAHGGKLPPARDFKWIKADLTWPAFDHLTFGYGNQVFSVLVDLKDGSQCSLSTRETKRWQDACLENNLVPCLFPVDVHTLKPISPGWNLYHLGDFYPVNPFECIDDAQVEMSAWEIRNFCLQIVRQHIADQMGAKVLSFCDVLGIDPQIWFEDKSGARSWVVVRHYPVITGQEKTEWVRFERSNPQLASYDGFLAAVSLASSEPILLDKSGRIIPPSERFSGNEPLYRGDGFYIKFDGLQRIHASLYISEKFIK